MKKVFNKGFTMVELIIVIAIIAILAAVLAPQYLRFVEDSRESNDIQTAALIEESIIIAVADNSQNFAGVTEITWETTGSGKISAGSGTDSAALNAIIDIVGQDAVAAESVQGKAKNFVWSLDVGSGAVRYTEESNNPADWE